MPPPRVRPGDAGVGDGTGRGGEPERVRLQVQLPEQRAGLRPARAVAAGRPPPRASVRHRSPCRCRSRTVRRGCGRRRAPRSAGRGRSEAHRTHHVPGTGAAHDEGGLAVEGGAIPQPPRRIVARRPGGDELAPQPGAQVLDVVASEVSWPSVAARMATALAASAAKARRTGPRGDSARQHRPHRTLFFSPVFSHIGRQDCGAGCAVRVTAPSSARALQATCLWHTSAPATLARRSNHPSGVQA